MLRSQHETFEQTIAASENISSSAATVPTNGTGNGVNNNHAPATTEAGIQSVNSSFNTQGSDEKPSKNTELQRLRTEYGVAWIMYMRFGRRSEGVESLRGIFFKARKDRFIPWEVYEASGMCFFFVLPLRNNLFFSVALMEYHCSDDRAVASRIFERGLNFFGDEIDYVLRYLGFLISINDESSKCFSISSNFPILMRYILLDARALFERVIPNFSADRARPLWERWARYEYQYGDLEAALKLEKRMAEVYASGMIFFFFLCFYDLITCLDPPIKRFAQRHMYLGIDAIADRDLEFAMARKATATSTLGKSETQQSISGLNQGTKRMASPDYRNKREDNRGGSGGSADYNGQGSDRLLNVIRSRATASYFELG